MNDLAIVEHSIAMLPEKQRTTEEVKQHVGLIQSVMKSVMKPETHYGVIPGCNQPTLYKAGSEVLLTTFMIGTRVDVEDLSTGDCYRYRVKVIGFHQPTGRIMGEGVGECSTDETKYKWKCCYIEEEFNDTQETRRKYSYYKAQNGTVYKNMLIRTEPADLSNTVLKMAKKRAQIDFTLTALGASDIFTQDIEDLPPEVAESVTGGSQQKGKPLKPAEQPLTQPQLEKLRSEMAAAGIDDAAICEQAGVSKIEDIVQGRMVAAIKWVKSQGGAQ